MIQGSAVTLASQSRFDRAAPAPEEYADPNRIAIVQRLLGRHCAGLAERPYGAAMYRYLLARPPAGRRRNATDWAAYSLLGKCTPMEIVDLLGFCQIPASRIAAHVRALGVTNQPGIRFLNQLAP